MNRANAGAQEPIGPCVRMLSISYHDNTGESPPAAVRAAIPGASSAPAVPNSLSGPRLRPGDVPPDTPVLVPLPKGHFTIVEIRDFDLIARFKWRGEAAVEEGKRLD